MTVEVTSKEEYAKVWDRSVPLVKVNEELYRVYLLEEIGSPSYYAELIDTLYNLDENCVVEVYLNTPGGMLDTTVMIVDAMKTTKAKLVGKVSGTVASAGTMLMMYMDELDIADFAGVMIHNYSGGISGKGNEIKAQQAFTEKANKDMFHSLYSGFLTTREINKVLKGEDMWMGKEEVEKRWDTYKNETKE